MQDPTSTPIPRTQGLLRRELLKAGALGAAGLLGPGTAVAADSEPRVRRYPTLGRTGMKISDISFGSSRMRDPKVVRYAYERGVNYFDSAEGYKGGSESLITAFRTGANLGTPLLQYYGLTLEPRQAAERGVAPFPHMLRWLR